MIRKTLNRLLWSGPILVVLSVAITGCGGGNADTTTTETTTATPPNTRTSTRPGNIATSTGTTSTGTTSAASYKGAMAAWGKVMAANAALDKVIKSKNLKAVHEAAFKVRDIVKTLPAQSQALSPDKRKALASQVRNVEQIAAMLDESGDSNNFQATQENHAAMNDALDIIKGLYPSGALK